MTSRRTLLSASLGATGAAAGEPGDGEGAEEEGGVRWTGRGDQP